MATNTLRDWFQTPLGQYLLDKERAYLDEVTPDIFGFHALQLGLTETDLLSANRITHKMRIAADGHVDVRASCHELPIATQSIDLVVLAHTLEFAEEPHAILREVDRVMMPEGRLVTETVAPVAAAILEQSSPAAAAQSDRRERRTAHRPFQAWIERLASQAIKEGGQASVIVITIPDEDVRPEFIQAQVTRIRNDLRPSDFAGSIAGGEIGVLLRDTPADRAAAVSARLEKLLQWDVNTGKAIQPSIGVASWSAETPIAGSILRAARENGAARAQR